MVTQRVHWGGTLETPKWRCVSWRREERSKQAAKALERLVNVKGGYLEVPALYRKVMPLLGWRYWGSGRDERPIWYTRRGSKAERLLRMAGAIAKDARRDRFVPMVIECIQRIIEDEVGIVVKLSNGWWRYGCDDDWYTCQKDFLWFWFAMCECRRWGKVCRCACELLYNRMYSVSVRGYIGLHGTGPIRSPKETEGREG